MMAADLGLQSRLMRVKRTNSSHPPKPMTPSQLRVMEEVSEGE